MTERERWIVYPLLVLALGASLRDKFGSPSQLDATQIRCDEIRATKLVIADPQNHQQRIVLRTVQEPTKSGAGGQRTVGQIEVLDHAQRPQTVIQHGVVHSPVLRTNAVFVFDQAGRPKVVAGAKIEETPADKGQMHPTSGFLEIFGRGNTTRPAVQLATSAEGGFVLTQREGLALGAAIGNFSWGSGACLQVGERVAPIGDSIPAQEIKKLEELMHKGEKNGSKKAAKHSGESRPATAAAVQPTGSGAATKP